MSDEQTQKEEKPAELSAKDIDAGNKSETISMLNRADKVAERMEQANKKAEELLARQEAIAARMIIGGRAEAGTLQKTAKEKQAEEIAKKLEALDKRYRG